MKHNVATVAKWLSGLLFMAAAAVLVAALFAPRFVQPLNGLVCDPGFEISNERVPLLANPRQKPPLELSCVADMRAVDATPGMARVLGGTVGVAIALLVVRHQLLRPVYKRPEIPTHV